MQRDNLASFRLVGNTPELKESLMIIHSGLVISLLRILSSEMGMLYGPIALPACRALIIISISTGVTGERK